MKLRELSDVLCLFSIHTVGAACSWHSAVCADQCEHHQCVKSESLEDTCDLVDLQRKGSAIGLEESSVILTITVREKIRTMPYVYVYIVRNDYGIKRKTLIFRK